MKNINDKKQSVLAQKLSKISSKTAMALAVCTACFLALVKLITGFLTGSAAIIASGIDSTLDVAISVFNFFVVSKSEKGSNTKFHYGFGKLESIAALLEGAIITFSGVFVIYLSVMKIYENQMLKNAQDGVFVMIFSSIVTLALVLFLNAVNKSKNSQVLSADILHYKSDLFSNLAVLVALFAVYFGAPSLIDPILGLLIGLYIIYQAFELIKNGVLLLLDHTIDEEKLEKIKTILDNAPITSYHALRTRQVANVIFVDVHLVFDMHISLYKAHKINDDVENAIRRIDETLAWDIMIHLDPQDDSHLDIKI